VYARGSDHTCAPDVHEFSIASVFGDFGGDITKRAGEKEELLVRKVNGFYSVKR